MSTILAQYEVKGFHLAQYEVKGKVCYQDQRQVQKLVKMGRWKLMFLEVLSIEGEILFLS